MTENFRLRGVMKKTEAVSSAIQAIAALHAVDPLELKHSRLVRSSGCTVLYLEVSVLLEALPNSVNPKLPISVKTL